MNPSWWFQPIWKICSSNWITVFPPFSGWKFQKSLKPPPRISSKYLLKGWIKVCFFWGVQIPPTPRCFGSNRGWLISHGASAEPPQPQLGARSHRPSWCSPSSCLQWAKHTTVSENIHNICNPTRNTCNPTRNLTSHPSGKLILVRIQPITSYYNTWGGDRDFINAPMLKWEGLGISKDAVPCCINLSEADRVINTWNL